jgi:queuine tRNA-ribosyltransferase
VRHVTKAQRRQRERKLGRYEVVVSDGVGRIRDMTSGEVMHPVDDPSEEARSLYVEQSRLVERLSALDSAPFGAAHAVPLRLPNSVPLVVWDVGLGAAANAMAAIRAVEALLEGEVAPVDVSVHPRLQIVSFENDLDSLTLALKHPAWFKHLRHAAPRALLAQDRWVNAAAGIEWRLMRGDFAARKFEAPLPDIVFFDPFSFKTDSELWSVGAFREMAELFADKAVELYTYTYSTRVRAAMLAAGFHVAKGRGTGPKAETTIGLSAGAAARPHGHELLGAEWLARWRRSDAQAPLGVRADDESWRAAVEGHPQFAKEMLPFVPIGQTIA